MTEIHTVHYLLFAFRNVKVSDAILNETYAKKDIGPTYFEGVPRIYFLDFCIH